MDRGLETANAKLIAAIMRRDSLFVVALTFFVMCVFTKSDLAFSVSLAASLLGLFYHIVLIPEFERIYAAAQRAFIGALWADPALLNKSG